jgi:hypothetical protein
MDVSSKRERITAARGERTLLSAAFDLDLALDLGLGLQNQIQNQHQNNFKGSGQECPLYTRPT